MASRPSQQQPNIPVAEFYRGNNAAYPPQQPNAYGRGGMNIAAPYPQPQQQQHFYGGGVNNNNNMVIVQAVPVDPRAGAGAAHAQQQQRQQVVHVYVVPGDPIYGADIGTKDLQDNMKSDGSWKDAWAIILIAANILAIVIVGAMNIADGKLASGSSSSTTSLLIRGAGAGVGIGLGMCLVFLLLLKAFAAFFIWAALVLFAAMWLALGVLGITTGNSALAVWGFILCAISVAWIFCVRHTIPFSSLMLETASDVVMSYWGVFVASFVFLVSFVVYYVFWIATTIPFLNSIERNDSDRSTTSGQMWLFILLMFCFYMSQYFHGLMAHATTCGAVATWFFSKDQMPESVAPASMKRACTTSLGSISLASFILAILRTLEMMMRMAANRSRNGLLACCCAMILSCIARVAEFFSLFGIAQVAITGDSLMDGSKRAWEMLQGSFWSSVISVLLVERVFLLLTLIVVVVCAVASYFITASFAGLVGGLLAGLVCANVMLSPPASGVISLMVCTAEYPDVLNKPTHNDFRTKLLAAVASMEKGCCEGDDGAAA